MKGKLILFLVQGTGGKRFAGRGASSRNEADMKGAGRQVANGAGEEEAKRK